MPPENLRPARWHDSGVITRSPVQAFSRPAGEHALPDGFLRRVNTRNHLDNAWARFERHQRDLARGDHAFAAEGANRRAVAVTRRPVAARAAAAAGTKKNARSACTLRAYHALGVP